MENSHWRLYRSEEFREEDVWDVIVEESETGFRDGKSNGTKTPHSILRRLPSAARMIPVAKKHHQSDRSGENDQAKVMLQHSVSAPVNVPDWSKIYRKSSRWKKSGTSSSSHDHYDVDDDIRHEENGEVCVDDDDGDGDGDGDADDGRLPPHEWLARKLARSQISSFSVCEGAGRTLKGRDQSRVRHDVLSKTGFI